MTSPGDIYYRAAFKDHIIILKARHYDEKIYQFRWLELESGRYATYTNPFGDELEELSGGEAFIKVA